MATMKNLIPRGKQFNTYVTRIGASDHVVLYDTTIAIRDNEKGVITLNHGGHPTPTTFRRMNECLNEWLGANMMKINKATFKDASVRFVDTLTATLITGSK